MGLMLIQAKIGTKSEKILIMKKSNFRFKKKKKILLYNNRKLKTWKEKELLWK
jgi:hypothetical protein